MGSLAFNKTNTLLLPLLFNDGLEIVDKLLPDLGDGQGDSNVDSRWVLQSIEMPSLSTHTVGDVGLANNLKLAAKSWSGLDSLGDLLGASHNLGAGVNTEVEKLGFKTSAFEERNEERSQTAVDMEPDVLAQSKLG
ncbi:hypothetical protein HG530_001041 [Fusarium avenaceum]|nr:hypothetical protein HG530_001041 [Fusarium avenaceum]